MLRYALILIAAMIATPAVAECPGGVCRAPVRSVLQVPRKVARSLASIPAAVAPCGSKVTTTSTKQRRVTRTVTWHRTRLLHRLRFVPQRR